MPLNLTAPVNIVTPQTAEAINVIGFSVNNDQKIIDVVYEMGNYINSVFTKVGDRKTLHMNSSEFTTFLTNNPTLQPMLKSVLYGIIMSREGLAGTIV